MIASLRLILVLLFLHSSATFGQPESINQKQTENKIIVQQDSFKQSSIVNSNQKLTNHSEKNQKKLPVSNLWLIVSGFIGIFGSSLTWLYNEWKKRNDKLKAEKEERYKKLISLIPAFADATFDKQKTNEFINELQLCWMYCPDIIIEKGNSFIESLPTKGVKKEQKDIDKAKGELILEIRKDLLLTSKIFKFLVRKKITKLIAQDFKDVHYGFD